LLKEKLERSRSLRILKFMSKLLYRRASYVVGVSSPVVDDLKEYPGVQNVLVIPNTVETPSPSDIASNLSKRPNWNNRIACVGSLTAIKAQHLAIEALSLLPPQFSLSIVGDGPMATTLQERAKELAVDDRVEFLGFLDPAAVNQVLSDSSVLLHCSIAETFGLVYAEAADAGLPVISVETRAARQMIPAYSPGWLCQPEAGAIAETIEKAGSNQPIPAHVFSEAAQRRREDFGIERVRADWMRVMNAVSRPSDIVTSASREGTP